VRNDPSRWRSALVMLAVAAVLAGVVGLFPIASAPASTGTSVASTPATGLLDGQFVSIAWTGFTPGTPTNPQGVAVSQCSEHPVLPVHDCALSELGITGADGTGVLPIPVHTGKVQSRDGNATFTCDEDHPCTVAVYADPSKSLQSSSPSAVQTVTFGFPASACPHGGTAGINGSGGEAVFRAMLRWEAVVCQPPASLDLQYTRTESTEGKDALVGDGAGTPPDFAVSSEPLTAGEQAKLKTQKRTVFTAPVTASGLVFVFHGTDRVTGQRINNVTLTPSELAHIFNGTRNSLPVAGTSNAEDQDIVDLNPGVNFKGSLQAFGRLDAAAGTRELTSWMLTAAPDAWKDVPPWVAGRPSASGGPTETVDYQTPTDRMPDGLQGPGAVGQLINGSDNLALLLAGDGSLGDPPDLNLMGYLDASTARFYGLPTVCLQLDPSWRTTHTPCVPATSENISKGLAAAARNDDGTVTPNLAPADPSAYPIVDVSYLMGDVNQASAAKATTLKSLLTYAAGEGQKPAVLPPGYAPLPADLTKETTTAAAAVTGTDPPPPTPTDDVSTGGLGLGDGLFGAGLLSGGLGGSVPLANVGAAAAPAAKRVDKVEAVASLHYPKAGDQLSGRASWWVVFALTALCLAGLLVHPTVRSKLRTPFSKGAGPGSDPPAPVTS
jgi:ABC-type phosphate transport system substrate-binding protein